MRTYHVLGFTVCTFAVLAFAHCGPIAPSTAKNEAPAAAVSGKTDLQTYNSATVESNPGGFGAIAASSQWVASDPIDLQNFKDTGQIPIPSSLGKVDPNKVQVKILVNSSPDVITAKNMNPLRLTAGNGPKGSYLQVKDADKASEVQASVVGIQISPP